MGRKVRNPLAQALGIVLQDIRDQQTQEVIGTEQGKTPESKV